MIVTVTLNPAIDKKIMTDEIDLGETNKCQLRRTDVAGKGINVSKSVASLGYETVALGFIGGTGGKMIQDYLSAQRISNDFTKINQDIRTNIKLIEKRTGRETEINEDGPVITHIQIEGFLSTFRKYLKEGRVLSIGGSIPGGIPQDFYYHLIKLAKEEGMKVVFDSSEACFKEGVKAVPDAIKPNIHEMETYFHEKIHTLKDIKDKARRFIDMGIGLVAVSMGADGACFITREYSVKAKLTEKLMVKGAIGAGDAMTSALAISLLDGMSFQPTVRFAVAAASASVIEEGTVPGRNENIQRFKHLVSVEDID